MGLCDDVRRHCAEVAGRAEWVAIDHRALTLLNPDPGRDREGAAAGGEVGSGAAAVLDPRTHLLDAEPEAVAAYLLILDAINFGSGWFPTLRKRPGVSGYTTIAGALADHCRADGCPTNPELRRMSAGVVAGILGQPADHELMALYAQALRALGRFLGGRSALELVAGAGGSAERLAESLAGGMAMFADHGFYKRAQITTSDLALAGLGGFTDLDRLTVFADNVVPHVLRCEGVLRYDRRLADHIDAGRLLAPGRQEREIRAAAVHAGELLSARLGVAPRVLDGWLWNRGGEARFKARPRHRCRCVFY